MESQKHLGLWKLALRQRVNLPPAGGGGLKLQQRLWVGSKNSPPKASYGMVAEHGLLVKVYSDAQFRVEGSGFRVQGSGIRVQKIDQLVNLFKACLQHRL